MRDILKTIMELYSSAGSVFHGAEYADPKVPRSDIVDPSLSIYGTTTPETFYSALGSGDVASGNLNRWLIAMGDVDAKFESLDFNRQITNDPPQKLVDWLRDAASITPEDATGNLAGVEIAGAKTTDPIAVAVSPDAQAVFQQVVAEQEKRRTDAKDPLRDLWVRLFENTMKVAAIRAIADDPQTPVISEAHAQWAKDLVTWCIESASHMIQARVGDNERQKTIKEIWRYIYEAGPGGRDLQHVTKKFQKTTRRDRWEMLSELEVIEAIEETEVRRKNAKRPTTVYVALGAPS